MVASNADVVHTYAQLLGDEPARPRRGAGGSAGKRFSMSLFVLYFGLTRPQPQLQHHTVCFGPRYRELIDEIFHGEALPDDFSLYLHAPCVTDPSLAPPGCGSYYVLAPVPHLGNAPIDWAVEGPRCATASSTTWSSATCRACATTWSPAASSRRPTSATSSARTSARPSRWSRC